MQVAEKQKIGSHIEFLKAFLKAMAAPVSGLGTVLVSIIMLQVSVRYPEIHKGWPSC